MSLNHVSLFSGIGGIDLACDWAGFETVLQVESDEYCQKVLTKHWPDVPGIGDVRDVTETSVRERLGDRRVHLLSGGFPCQPYSTAGEQRGEEDHRDLWPEMHRVIRLLRPRWVLGENVAHFANLGLDRSLAALVSEGYTAWTVDLPAVAVGAPHRRQRVFFVAYSGEQHEGSHRREDGRMGRFRERLQDLRAGEGPPFPLGTGLEGRGFPWSTTHPSEGAYWEFEGEPELRGDTDDGFPDRVDRIKRIGNAVCPQQVFPIVKAIVLIEHAIQGGEPLG